MAWRPMVAVVGGGFAGVLTALNLLGGSDPPQVRLIERRGVFARGAAYSTANPDHLLNVRLSNMSAFPDQPDHFADWLANHSGWTVQGGFVTRGVYGDYLQDLLRRELRRRGGESLLLEADEAVDVEPLGRGWRVHLALGRSFDAEAVVIACGVLRPAPPEAVSPDLLHSERFLANPWSPDQQLPEDAERVLLIGGGLTMIDAAITHGRPGRRFWSISRRGLRPRTHGPSNPPHVIAPPAGTPSVILRELRRRIAASGDWRVEVDAVRPYVQSIWVGWSDLERRQFLRHLQPWWEVHRHRLAPSVAHRLEDMTKAGALTHLAGDLVRLGLEAEGVRATWRPRGAHVLRRLGVDAVINCTGVAGDIERSGEPLIRRLLDRGLVRPDPCRLGMDVDGASRLIDRTGRPQSTLFAVGAMTRGAFWEMTSVPDLRLQTRAVAEALTGVLRRQMAMARDHR